MLVPVALAGTVLLISGVTKAVAVGVGLPQLKPGVGKAGLRYQGLLGSLGLRRLACSRNRLKAAVWAAKRLSRTKRTARLIPSNDT
jgi:hypothetical protein